jgi:hypothetical protein
VSPLDPAGQILVNSNMIPILSLLDTHGNNFTASVLDLKKNRQKQPKKNPKGFPRPGGEFVAHGKKLLHFFIDSSYRRCHWSYMKIVGAKLKRACT